MSPTSRCKSFAARNPIFRSPGSTATCRSNRTPIASTFWKRSAALAWTSQSFRLWYQGVRTTRRGKSMDPNQELHVIAAILAAGAVASGNVGWKPTQVYEAYRNIFEQLREKGVNPLPRKE